MIKSNRNIVDFINAGYKGIDDHDTQLIMMLKDIMYGMGDLVGSRFYITKFGNISTTKDMNDDEREKVLKSVEDSSPLYDVGKNDLVMIYRFFDNTFISSIDVSIVSFTNLCKKFVIPDLVSKTDCMLTKDAYIRSFDKMLNDIYSYPMSYSNRIDINQFLENRSNSLKEYNRATKLKDQLVAFLEEQSTPVKVIDNHSNIINGYAFRNDLIIVVIDDNIMAFLNDTPVYKDMIISQYVYKMRLEKYSILSLQGYTANKDGTADLFNDNVVVELFKVSYIELKNVYSVYEITSIITKNISARDIKKKYFESKQ